MIPCTGCNVLFSFAGYSRHLTLTTNPPCVVIHQRASNPREEVDGESSEKSDVNYMSNGIAFQAPFPCYDSLPASGHLSQPLNGFGECFLFWGGDFDLNIHAQTMIHCPPQAISLNHWQLARSPIPMSPTVSAQAKKN
jgi:hypothetical protein